MQDSTNRRRFMQGGIGGLLAAAVTGRSAQGLQEVSDTRRQEEEDVNQADRIRPFPIFRAQGTHRQLGRLHGEQAAEQIKAHLEYMGTTMKLSRAGLQNRALRFRPLFEKHCPQLLDEIEGLAEGAGIAPAAALAVNIRGALGSVQDEGCTAYAIGVSGTAAGNLLIGQNSDMLPAAIDFAYVLSLKPQDKPEVLMWTFGGMVGYHGLNSHGVAHFANDLGGGPQPRFGMPHYPVKRQMLECSRIQEVVALLQRTPLWANGNYVVCDGTGQILDIEATTEGPELVTDQGADFLAHSNHFVSEKYATQQNHDDSAADSFPRLERMQQLIQASFGQISVHDVKQFLRDRAGHPSSICRFAQTTDSDASWVTAGITVASIIAEPQERRMHVAVGNQPDTPFVVYQMD